MAGEQRGLRKIKRRDVDKKHCVVEKLHSAFFVTEKLNKDNKCISCYFFNENDFH